MTSESHDRRDVNALSFDERVARAMVAEPLTDPQTPDIARRFLEQALATIDALRSELRGALADADATRTTLARALSEAADAAGGWYAAEHLLAPVRRDARFVGGPFDGRACAVREPSGVAGLGPEESVDAVITSRNRVISPPSDTSAAAAKPPAPGPQAVPRPVVVTPTPKSAAARPPPASDTSGNSATNSSTSNDDFTDAEVLAARRPGSHITIGGTRATRYRRVQFRTA